MSRNAAILERAAFATPDLVPALAAAPAPRSRPFSELAVRLFPPAALPRSVGFGSPGPGAGVSSVVRSLAAELARSGPVEVLAAPFPPRFAANLGASFAPLHEREENPIEAADARGASVLLDCGSLARSIDLLELAPALDGIVLIVEAGKTRKEEIERAASLVREAGGKLLGVVLNKRRYALPGWLYRAL